MSSQNKLVISSLFTLILVASFSYIRFAEYKPKSIIPIEEVHGVQTTTIIELPAPEDSEVIGSTITDKNKSYNYKTTKTSDEVQQFYRNIVLEEGWIVENEGNADIFKFSEYKREKDKIKITTSNQQNNGTIVNIEIWKTN